MTDKPDDSRSPEDSRPNLFGNSVGPASPSILSRIEPVKRASAPSTPDHPSASRIQPWVLAIGLGAAIVAVAIWAVARKAPDSGNEMRVSAASAESPTAPQASVVSSPASAAEVIAVAPDAVARLESIPPQQAPVAADAAASSAEAPAAASAVVTSAAPRPVEPVVAAKTATAAKSAARPSSSSAQRSSRTASSQAAPRERQARSRSRAAAAPASADADVTLLAAVIGHVEPSAAGGPAAQRDEATIAGLVRRCDTQADSGGALQCRRRICDGYWGKAQACPKRLAPPSAN